jgi:hypothetical protein
MANTQSTNNNLIYQLANKVRRIWRILFSSANHLRLIEVSAQETDSIQDVTVKNTPGKGSFGKPANFKTVKKPGLLNIDTFCGCLLLLFVIITCYSQISCIALPLHKNNVR